MELLDLVIAVGGGLKVAIIELIVAEVLESYPVLELYELRAEEFPFVDDGKLEH